MRQHCIVVIIVHCSGEKCFAMRVLVQCSPAISCQHVPSPCLSSSPTTLAQCSTSASPSPFSLSQHDNTSFPMFIACLSPNPCFASAQNNTCSTSILKTHKCLSHFLLLPKPKTGKLWVEKVWAQ